MTHIIPKERKYVECFKSIMDGSCNWCKTRSWNKGYKIYAMKKESDGKWLACKDKQCYLDQGGKLTLFSDTHKIQTKKCVCGDLIDDQMVHFHSKCNHVYDLPESDVEFTCLKFPNHKGPHTYSYVEIQNAKV